MKRVLLSVCMCCLTCLLSASELRWQTHFSYNNVEQIALYGNEVYALANGKLFSVDQQTENVTLYNNKSGVHGLDVAQLMTDTLRDQLLIMYVDGKVDVLRNGIYHYVSDLYNKKMTSSKRCNNITIAGDLAYLSMDFGILTFDLNYYEFKDTYYIGAEASEVKVQDVALVGDSIYAKTKEGVYSAAQADNIVDYRYWKFAAGEKPVFDAKKGKEYVNELGDVWKAVGTKGVSCNFITGVEHFYLPDGPQVNVPYNMVYKDGRLFVLPGGRWVVQNQADGHVMIYEGGEWLNITSSSIRKKTGKRALDFVSIAVDPNDIRHFYVGSYGTGLYEFAGDTLVHHYTPKNSVLGSAVASNPDYYTRIDGLNCDAEGRVWMQVADKVDKNIVAFASNGDNQGINLYNNNQRYVYETPGGLLIDKLNANRKWLLSCRKPTGLILLDDAGTRLDESDDRVKVQAEFYDQDNQVVVPEYMFSIAQAPNGDIWVGTTIGPVILPHQTDFFESTQCVRLRIDMPDGKNFLDLERVNAFAWDSESRVWIGTQTGGVYVLDADCKSIVAHYTSDNTVMPANTVMSLAYDDRSETMYVGTALGLVSVVLSDGSETPTDKGDEDDLSYGNMYQWRSHAAFTSMDEIGVVGDNVYARSGKSLFSVNKATDLLEYHNRLTGLSGAQIQHIASNSMLENLLVTYQDGKIDIINAAGDVKTVTDLYLKQMSSSKEVQYIYMYEDKAYLAMKFGIVVLDLRSAEIVDTYYIGLNSSEVDVQYLAIKDEYIYAASQMGLYVANLTDNLLDYNFWTKEALPNSKKLQGMCVHNGDLYVLQNGVLYAKDNDGWRKLSSEYTYRSMRKTQNHLYLFPKDLYGVAELLEDKIELTYTYGYVLDAAEDGSVLWFATRDEGLVKYENDYHYSYIPDGPSSNYSYRLRFFGDKLYMLPGGRWAAQYARPAEIMIYENGDWHNIRNGSLVKSANHALYDAMNVAQDPKDAEHYYVTTYGTGMLEMYGDSVVKLHMPHNSGLQSAVKNNPDSYTRTDGAMFDEQGNLWVLNMDKLDYNVRIMTPDQKWYALPLYSSGTHVPLYTGGEIMVDKRNAQWKWIPLLRQNTGLILLKDNGTPTNASDDRVMYRTEWMDQKGHLISPERIYCMAQDQNNGIWVGTTKGLFVMRENVDFFTSNACERIIIPRNDGSGLGDYLLENEQINSIVIDGANRLWIGTASSGLYLMGFTEDPSDDYTLEMLAHFTTENSLLPSDEVIALAIQESTGEVFIGTGAGLVSYMSDAIEPEENFSNLYVYPNPVRANYRGSVVIKGLMADTDVRIVDAAGELVKNLKGTGGEVIWDMTNQLGKRVASGVYTVLCNTRDGVAAETVKVLVMN